MKTVKPADQDELNLITLAKKYSDDDSARAYLESLLWPDGPTCPHCKAAGSECKDVYKIKPDAKSKTRKGVYCCAACRKQFTVTVGTVFESSHVPISTWVMAVFILCSSKKSISSNQLHRMLGVTYKTAWFMAHRIRFAMGIDNAKAPKLSGTVEADETFVGGKGDRKTTSQRKTPVVALIERGGQMRAKVISSVTQKNLSQCVVECVSKDAILNTDEHPGYAKQGKEHARHDTVVHSKFEYARKNDDGSVAHINTTESFFSLLKRGIVGSWHHVSREHLPKYVDEFAFRWNERKSTDGERTETFMPMIQGKRMYYRQPGN